jgi:secondary thiamine-phosphate synthase enzyme
VTTDVAVAKAMKVLTRTISIATGERFEVRNVTELFRELPAAAGVEQGLMLIQTLHTTTALFLNEFQDALLKDVASMLRRMIGEGDYYFHNDERYSDCDRSNAASHLRAMLLGHTLSIPIVDGRLLLGRWQRILFAELDGPQTRSVVAQMIGA